MAPTSLESLTTISNEKLTQTLLERLDSYEYTPDNIQNATLDLLERSLNGLSIVDPTHPLTFLLEANSTISAHFIQKSESLIRRAYPALAQNKDELYYHMSDRDYFKNFAIPSTTKLHVFIVYSELMKSSTKIPGSELQYLVIPRTTTFSVNDITFGLYHPIRIDISTKYDTYVGYYETKEGGIFQDNDNISITSNTVTLDGVKYLELIIPVAQYTLDSKIFNIYDTGRWMKELPFTDQFMYLDVYGDFGNNKWEPIHTTHNTEIYDPNELTLTYRILEKSIKAFIPEVYFNRDNTANRLRVDIYTTKGALDMNLKDYPANMFSAQWNRIDEFMPIDRYLIMNNISDLIIMGSDRVIGGVDAVPFEEIKKEIVHHNNALKAPVKPTDIINPLGKLGYIVEKIRDTISEKEYLAIKAVDTKKVNNRIYKVETVVADVLLNRKYAENLDYKQHIRASTFTGYRRYTVMPYTLFEYKDTDIRILTDTESANLYALQQSAPELFMHEINTRTLYATPYHYVIHVDDPYPVMIPYDLNNPYGKYQTTLAINKNAQVLLVTKNIEILYTESGYEIHVDTLVPVDNVFVDAQLVWEDQYGLNTYYNSVQAIQLSDNITRFIFRLDTTFDINRNHLIEITSGTSHNGEQRIVEMDLHTEFKLYYIIDDNGKTPINTLVDEISLHPYIGTHNVSVLSKEKLLVHLGQELTLLFTEVLEFTKEPQMTTYTEDKPLTYQQDIYNRDADGNILYTIDGTTVTLDIAHHKGDVITDEDGNILYEHKAGDPVYDENGKPVYIEDGLYETWENVKLTLFNAKYLFVTEPSIKTYYDDLGDFIRLRMDTDIKPYKQKLSELTNLYYTPGGTTPNQITRIGDGQTIHQNIVMDITVLVYLNEVDIVNEDLKTRILSKLYDELYIEINKRIFSPSNITTKVMGSFMDNVKAIDIIDNNTSTPAINIQLTNNIHRFMYRQQLFINDNGYLDIRDSIEIKFKVLKDV